jgi:hypothetical protein
MSNEIGKILAILMVMVAVCAAVLLGGTDVSSPALAAGELRQGTPGAATASVVFNYVVGALVGILLTAVIGGIGGVVFIWLRDWYESRQKGDWEAGPNANFRRRGQRNPQAMSRDEMFQIAILSALTQGRQQVDLPQISPPAVAEQDPTAF